MPISMSVSIETIQFFVRYIGEFRSSDIDDVILNTIGAFIGIVVFKKVTAARVKRNVEFPT
ncbi:VanZ family protein [Clostridium hydrogenum]|uniref:VanZ family protein n=1 Tax=Clostridium hydrogenum TaxID=2855764 RepID=UPI001F22D48F|nr:VanZ family protein [Clostridium hydrogenum]